MTEERLNNLEVVLQTEGTPDFEKFMESCYMIQMYKNKLLRDLETVNTFLLNLPIDKLMMLEESCKDHLLREEFNPIVVEILDIFVGLKE